MSLSSIAIVFARLFAIKWALFGLSVVAYPLLVNDESALSFLPALVYFLGGVAHWFLAPALARLVTRGADDSVRLDGITQEQLYAVVLFGLGVYFFLSSFGQVVNWSHYLLVSRGEDSETFRQAAQQKFFAGFTQPLLTMLAGLGILFKSKALARRFSRDETPAG